MSFQAGLSGLNAASEALDVISNNVANAGTKGFKKNTVAFADVVASSNSSSASSFGGIGVMVSSTQKSFTQGNISTTSNPLDMAINGNGFFVMDKNGSRFYSRDGGFSRDANGYLVNSTGAKVMGFQAVNGSVPSSGPLVPLQLTDSMLSPKQTTTASVAANLDSRAVVPTAAFDPTDSSTWNSSTSMEVYDSLGNPHNLSMYFVKSAAGTWDVQATSDGASIGSLGTLNFSATGLATGTTTFTANLPVSSGGTSPLSVAMDFGTVSQFGSASSVSSLTQDGYAAGNLTGFSTSADGIVTGSYSNGKTMPVGRVALANFTSPEGLSSVGNNLFAETSSSGQPLVGAPGSGTTGVLSSGALEDSNVDLTQELVDMIVAQRNYQANAQSIKTQDQIMQTLVNLR